MEKELTGQGLQGLVESLQTVFDVVNLMELEDGQAVDQPEDGLRVQYEVQGGRIGCSLCRTIRAGDKTYQLHLSAPLAGNGLPEDRMTERERRLFREDLNHDFLSGVYNRHYLDTIFREKVDTWAAQGMQGALALISLDGYAGLEADHGQPTVDQVLCYVANQWKKHYDQSDKKLVCRLDDAVFAVACSDYTGPQLEAEMRAIYDGMPTACITSVGMMSRVPFTLSIGCAGVEELENRCWDSLYELCQKRLAAARTAGGDQVFHTEG